MGRIRSRVLFDLLLQHRKLMVRILSYRREQVSLKEASQSRLHFDSARKGQCIDPSMGVAIRLFEVAARGYPPGKSYRETADSVRPIYNILAAAIHCVEHSTPLLQPNSNLV